MPKRFIDTGFMDQKWIRKLSPERKIFIIYLMLKCDNAGIIDFDLEDAEFWIGKKIGEPSKFLPEDFFIQVNDEKYFIPKFLKWQYPNFPHSKVHQQKQAINILAGLKLFDIEKNELINIYPNFTQDLPKNRVIGNDNGNVDDNVSDNDNAEAVIFPFESDEFSKWWGYWKEYKSKEHKFRYKSVISEQAALKGLSEKADGNQDAAIKIIEQSISNGWKGFFELKNDVKEATSMDSYKDELKRRIGNEH